MTYHAGTDVAFEEKTIRERPITIESMHSRNWPESTFPTNGCRSLRETATLVAVANVKDLNKITLESVPWHIAEKMWTCR